VKSRIDPTSWIGRMVEAAGGVGKLADRIGVSARSVRRWALGQSHPSRLAGRRLRVVADALGVPPANMTRPPV
jgi:DNA-binding transcriptional regulator YdaS (Cro superfamily)